MPLDRLLQKFSGNLRPEADGHREPHLRGCGRALGGGVWDGRRGPASWGPHSPCTWATHYLHCRVLKNSCLQACSPPTHPTVLFSWSLNSGGGPGLCAI